MASNDTGVIDRTKEEFTKHFIAHSIQFHVFVLALLLAFIWVVYVTLYNARFCGWLVTLIVSRFMPKGTKLQFGSFTVSALGGKILFRDVRYITTDYAVRIGDGYLLFRYWLPYLPGKLLDIETTPIDPEANPNDGERQRRSGQGQRPGFGDRIRDKLSFGATKGKTRVKIVIDRFDLHIYNRTETYTRLFQLFGIDDPRWTVPPKATFDSSQLPAEQQSESFMTNASWNFRQVCPVTKCSIYGMRIVFGHARMRTNLALISNEARIVYDFPNAESPFDEFTHRLQCAMNGARVTFLFTNSKREADATPARPTHRWTRLRSRLAHFFDLRPVRLRAGAGRANREPETVSNENERVSLVGSDSDSETAAFDEMTKSKTDRERERESQPFTAYSFEDLDALFGRSKPVDEESESAARVTGVRALDMITTDACEFSMHMDQPGKVPREPERVQLIGGDFVVRPSFARWTIDVRCIKHTHIAYGPFFDEQRDAVYKFLFPTDYHSQTPTHMPAVGQTRTYKSLDIRVDLLSTVSIDVVFNGREVTNADDAASVVAKSNKSQVGSVRYRTGAPRPTHTLHVAAQKGSYVSMVIPWLIGKAGTRTEMRGALQHADVTTNLSYRRLLEAENCEFSMDIHRPLGWNDEQHYALTVDLGNAALSFVMEHVRFFADLGLDWSSDSKSDLLNFVPVRYTVDLHFRHLELLTLVNQNNWTDVENAASVGRPSSTLGSNGRPTSPNHRRPPESDENTYLAICVEQLDVAVLVPFDDFLPQSVTYTVQLRAQDASGWLIVPESSTSRLLLLSTAENLRLLDRNGNVIQKETRDRERNEAMKSFRNVRNASDAIECLRTSALNLLLTYTARPNPVVDNVDRFHPSSWAEKARPFTEAAARARPKSTAGPEAERLRPKSTYKRAADTTGYATVDEFLRHEFDPSYLEPDILKLQLDIGPQSSLFLHGAFLRCLWNFKMNYFGTDDHVVPFDAPSQRVASSLGIDRDRKRAATLDRDTIDDGDVDGKTLFETTDLLQFDPRKYRPMHTHLQLVVRDIQAHLVRPCAEDDPPCASLFLKQLVFEMQKEYRETHLQLLLPPALVWCAPSSVPSGWSFDMSPADQTRAANDADATLRSQLNSTKLSAQDASRLVDEQLASVGDGFLVLSGLQFRGHGMFSRVGLPLAADTVEYAWLLDVQVGSLFGRLTAPQILHLVSAADLAIFAIENAENELQPVRDHVMIECHHGLAQSECNASVVGGTGRPPLDDAATNRSTTLCPTSEELKYEMTRLKVDSLNLFIVDSGCALNLRIEKPIRFATCNLHNEHNKAGITALIDTLVVRQLLAASTRPPTVSMRRVSGNQSQSDTRWLLVGEMSLGPIDIDAGIALPSAEMLALQASFLRKHDASTRRLTFMWDTSAATAANNASGSKAPHTVCGCVGGCVFFGRDDTARSFYASPHSALQDAAKIWTERERVAHNASFVRNGESLLNRNESLLKVVAKIVRFLDAYDIPRCHFEKEDGDAVLVRLESHAGAESGWPPDDSPVEQRRTSASAAAAVGTSNSPSASGRQSASQPLVGGVKRQSQVGREPGSSNSALLVSEPSDSVTPNRHSTATNSTDTSTLVDETAQGHKPTFTVTEDDEFDTEHYGDPRWSFIGSTATGATYRTAASDGFSSVLRAANAQRRAAPSGALELSDFASARSVTTATSRGAYTSARSNLSSTQKRSAVPLTASRTTFVTADDAEYYSAEEDPDDDGHEDDEKRSLATRSKAMVPGGRGEIDSSLRRHSLDVLNHAATQQPGAAGRLNMNVPEPLRFSMNVNMNKRVANLREDSSSSGSPAAVTAENSPSIKPPQGGDTEAEWLEQNRARLAQIMPHLFAADEEQDDALSSVSSCSTLSLPSSIASDFSLPRARSAGNRNRQKSKRSTDRLDTLNLHEHMNKRIVNSPILLNAYERHLAAFNTPNWNAWTCQTNRAHVLTLFHDTVWFARWPTSGDIADLSKRMLPQFELLRAGFSAALLCSKPGRLVLGAGSGADAARPGALGDVLASSSNPEDSMSVSISAASQLGDMTQHGSNMAVSRTTAIVRVDEAVRILFTPLVLEAAERYVASLKRTFETLHVYTVFNQLHAKCVHAVLAKNKLKKEKFRSKLGGFGDDGITSSSVDDLLSSIGAPRARAEIPVRLSSGLVPRKGTESLESGLPGPSTASTTIDHRLGSLALSSSDRRSINQAAPSYTASDRPASLLFDQPDMARLDTSFSVAVKSNRLPITHASRRLQVYFSVSQINICFLQTSVLEDSVSLSSISPTEVRELVGVCLASFCIDSVQCQVLTDHQSRKRSALASRQRKMTGIDASVNGGSRSALDELSRPTAAAEKSCISIVSDSGKPMPSMSESINPSAQLQAQVQAQTQAQTQAQADQLREQIEASNVMVASTGELVTEDDVGVVQFRHIHAQLRRLTRQTNFSRNVQVTALPNQRSRVLFTFNPAAGEMPSQFAASAGLKNEGESEVECRSELAEQPVSEEQLQRSLERHAAGFIMFECGLEGLSLRGFRRIGYVDEDEHGQAATGSGPAAGTSVAADEPSGQPLTGCSSPSTDGDQPDAHSAVRRELSSRSVDAGASSELEGDGSLCQFELKQFWFNFAAPPANASVKTVRNRAAMFTRFDWNLLSTAATLIRAWMTPTDRLLISARAVQSTLVRRIFATMVCCMVNAKDYPGVKGNRDHSLALARLTELARIVRDDPSVQVFAILRRYVLKRGVSEIDLLLSDEPPSIEALEKGIRALTREWKTFVDVPFHEVAAQQRRSTLPTRRRRGDVPAPTGMPVANTAGISVLAANDAFFSTYADEFNNEYVNDEPFEEKLPQSSESDPSQAFDRPDGEGMTQSAYEWARHAQFDSDDEAPPDNLAQRIRVRALNLANLAFQATSAQVLFRPLLESMSLHIQGIKATPLMKQFGGHFAASARLRELRVDICDSFGNPLQLMLTMSQSQRSAGSEPHSPTWKHLDTDCRPKNSDGEHPRRMRRRKPRVRFDSGTHTATLLCESFEAAVSIRDVIDFADDAISTANVGVGIPTSPVHGGAGQGAPDSPSPRVRIVGQDRVLFAPDSPKRTRVVEQRDDLEVRRTTTVVHFDFGIDSIEQHVDMTLLRLVSQFMILANHISGSKTEIEHKRVELQSELFRKTHRKQESKGSSVSTGLTTSSIATVPPPTDTHTVATSSIGGQPARHAEPHSTPTGDLTSQFVSVSVSMPAQRDYSGQMQPSTGSESTQHPAEASSATSASVSEGTPNVQLRRKPGSSFRRPTRVGEYGLLRSSNRSMRRKRESPIEQMAADEDASQSQSRTDGTAPLSDAARVWQRMNAIIDLYSHAPETKTFDLPVAPTTGRPSVFSGPTGLNANRQSTFMGMIGGSAPGAMDESDTKVVMRRRPAAQVQPEPQSNTTEQQQQQQSDELLTDVAASAAYRSPQDTVTNRQSLFGITDSAPMRSTMFDGTLRRTAGQRAAGEQMHVRLPPATFDVLAGTRERVSIALVGTTRARRLRVTAAISGLQFEAEVSGIAASVSHSTRIDNMFVRTALSSAVTHVGCVMLTLKEGPRTREAVIVSVAIRRTDGIFATRSRRLREHNSASGVCESIEIDIPHHPVALHGMVTRSQKHLTSTIQEILRYAPPSAPSAPPSASTNADPTTLADALDTSASVSKPATTVAAAPSLTAVDSQPNVEEHSSARNLAGALVPVPNERSSNRVSTRSAGRTPIVHFNAQIKLIALGAAVLPSVKAQYRVGPISTHGVSGNRAIFYVDVPSHSLNFSATMASMPSSTSLNFPAIRVHAEYRTPASSEAPLGATPRRRTAFFPERPTSTTFDNDQPAPGDRSPARPGTADGSYLDVTADVELFEYSVTADLLNHLIFAQKVFMKEINEVIQKVSGDDGDELLDGNATAEVPAAANDVTQVDDAQLAADRTQNAVVAAAVNKKEPVVYRMEIRFRGISISATTTSATPSAVRLDTNEIVLSLNNCTPPTDAVLASLPADVIDTHKLFAEMKVDVTLALGQIVRTRTGSDQQATAAPGNSPTTGNTNTNAEEPSGEFVPQAFFKTHIELCNSRPGEMWLLLQRSFAEFESAAQDQPTASTPASRAGEDAGRRSFQHRPEDSNWRRTDTTNSKRLPPFLAKFQHAEHDAVYVTLRRPIVYLQAAAIDQAMMIWLNYKHAYDYWMEQTSELHGAETHKPATNATTPARHRTRSSVISTSGVTPLATNAPTNVPAFGGASQQALQSTSILFLQLTVENLGACFPLGPVTPGNRTTSPTTAEGESGDRQAKTSVGNAGARASLAETRFARVPARVSTASLPVTTVEQRYRKRTASPENLETGHALVLTLETTRISACSAGEFVSRGIFQNFCLRFADQFDANANDWRPPEAIRSQLLLNAAVIPQGTYEVCSTTVSRSHHSASVARSYNLQSMMANSADPQAVSLARRNSQTGLTGALRAKWILNFAWHMKGIEMHLDSSIGKRLSVLIDTMTSVALNGSIDDSTPTGSRSSRSASNNQTQQSTLRREHAKRPSLTSAADLETVYEATRSGEFTDALDTANGATHPNVLDVDLDIAFINDESIDFKTRVQLLDSRILEQQHIVAELERSRNAGANTSQPFASVYEPARSVYVPDIAGSAIDIESQKLQRLQQVRLVLTKRDVFFHRTRPKGFRLIRDTLSFKPNTHRRSKSLAHTVFNPQQLASQSSVESATLERISESVSNLNSDQPDSVSSAAILQDDDQNDLHKRRTTEPPSTLLSRGIPPMRRSVSSDEDADGMGVRLRSVRGRQASRSSADSKFVTAIGYSQLHGTEQSAAATNSAPKIGFELDLRISIESGKWYLHPRVQAVASVQDRQAAMTIVQKTFGKQALVRINDARARQASNMMLGKNTQRGDRKTEKGMIALDPVEIVDPQIQYGFMVQRFKQYRGSIESEINVFIFPGVRFNMHYASRTGVNVSTSPSTPLAVVPLSNVSQTRQPKLDSTRPAGRSQDAAAPGDEQKNSASSGTHNAHLYAFFAIEKLGEDIIVTPALLDFLEQVIEPINAPNNLLLGGRHRGSGTNVNDDGSAMLRGSAADNEETVPNDDEDLAEDVSLLAAASIPIDVVVYVRVEPSCIRCGTYPVSRVEMLLKWPLVEVVMSSKRALLGAIDAADSTSAQQPGTDSSSSSQTSASSRQNTSSSSTPLAGVFGPSDLRRIAAIQSTSNESDSPKHSAESPIEGGLSITGCLSDLSFNVFHPYRGAYSDVTAGVEDTSMFTRSAASSFNAYTSDSRERDSLSMCVTFVKVNVARTRKLQTAALATADLMAGASVPSSSGTQSQSASSSTRNDGTNRQLDGDASKASASGAQRGDMTNAVHFSAVCHIGTASFDFDFRRLVEIRAIPKAWFRPALARFIFLGDPSLLEEGGGAPVNAAAKKQHARTPSPTRPGRVAGVTRNEATSGAHSEAQNGTAQPASSATGSGTTEQPSWARHHRRASSGDKWKFVSALQTQPTLSQQQRRFDDPPTTAKQNPSVNAVQQTPIVPKKRQRRVSWQTLVLVSVDFSKLDVKVNVGNVMGIVMWNTSSLRTHGRFTLDSAGNRLSKLSTVLERSSVTALGGIVGGLFDITDVNVYAYSLERSDCDPEDRLLMRLGCLESRVDYLSTSILTARITQFEADLHDEWTIRLIDPTAQASSAASEKQPGGRGAASNTYSSLPRGAARLTASSGCAQPTGSTTSLSSRQPTATVLLHGRLKWDRLDLLVSRSTTPELLKIHRKINEFFTKQIEESKRDLIGTFSKTAASRAMSRVSIRGGRPSHQFSVRRGGDELRRDPTELRREGSEPRDVDSRLTWQRILTYVSSNRLRFRDTLLPVNNLMAGGTLTLEGRQLKLACFHGITFKAHQWAVFALNEALITFSTDAQLEPLGFSDSCERRTHLIQNLELVLGRNGVRQRTEARMAFIDKLVCSHTIRIPQQESSVADWCAYAFNESNKYGHQTEPIFTLPSLLMHLLTEQHERWSVSSSSSNASLATPGTPHTSVATQSPLSQAVQSAESQPVVKCSFWTEFDSHIEVSIDPETIMFIRDVISGYVKDTERIGQKTSSFAHSMAADVKVVSSVSQPTPRLSSDIRQFAEPNPFILEPKIMLLTPIANVVPPGSDMLLRYLGFQHGRTTIPKWMQRGFMDPLNDAIAIGVQQLVHRFVDAPSDAQRGSGSQSGSQQALKSGSNGSGVDELQGGARLATHSYLHTVKE